MKHVKMIGSALGGYAIEIDGQDVSSSVSAVHFGAGRGMEPTLTLEVKSGLELDCDATVLVASAEQEKAAVLTFLDQVDSAWLEEAMAQDESLAVGVGEAAISLLKRRLAEHGT